MSDNVYEPMDTDQLRQTISRRSPVYQPGRSGFQVENEDGEYAVVTWKNVGTDETLHRDETEGLSKFLNRNGYESKLGQLANTTLIVRKVQAIVPHVGAAAMGPFEQQVESSFTPSIEGLLTAFARIEDKGFYRLRPDEAQHMAELGLAVVEGEHTVRGRKVVEVRLTPAGRREVEQRRSGTSTGPFEKQVEGLTEAKTIFVRTMNPKVHHPDHGWRVSSSRFRGRPRYFVGRTVDGQFQVLHKSNGNMRTWSSFDAAQDYIDRHLSGDEIVAGEV